MIPATLPIGPEKVRWETLSPTSDPKVLGPGTWWCIHTIAMTAVTEPMKQFFVAFILQLAQTFRCATCKKHIMSYLSNNPFSPYWEIEQGLFKWSVDFHNAVNTRIGKPAVSYELAKEWYTAPSECQTCGDGPYKDLSELTSREKSSVSAASGRVQGWTPRDAEHVRQLLRAPKGAEPLRETRSPIGPERFAGSKAPKKSGIITSAADD